MKNIFIEGIQGMGKSTLLNSISASITKLHICREGDYSPVDLAWCTWMSKEEYDKILKKYKPLQNEIIKNTVKEHGHYIVSYTKIITDFPNFHKDLEKYEIYNGRKTLQEFNDIILSRYKAFSNTSYLFECSFFQNIMENLILFYELDDSEIIDFYHKLYHTINKDAFLMLYLYSDTEQLEENIRIIKQERCDNAGNELWYPLMMEFLIHSPYGKKHGYHSFEDMIMHFRHRQQLELRIMEEIIGSSAIIVPAKNWNIDEIINLIKTNTPQ